ncbi:cation:proton antiporter, partial [Streptococcus pneumoniae]|uniref:cation:proton antiporter domain-containing protein n=1 Tax=Streptococcus pneumoniae TaxID=1313 RepID=UPI003D6631F9
MTRLDHREAIGRMSLMAHGGEFAFVLFSAAATAEVISNEEKATFTAAVIISMLFSPIIAQIARKLIQRTE